MMHLVLIHFDNLRQEALNSCIICCKISQLLSLPLNMYLCQQLWHLTVTDLGIAKLFNNSHFYLFLCNRWHILLVSTRQMLRYYCTARVTTPQFLVKSYSSCFSFFYMSYPSVNNTQSHNCFTIDFEQPVVNTSWLLTFSNKEPCHSLLFLNAFRNQLWCHYLLNGMHATTRK